MVQWFRKTYILVTLPLLTLTAWVAIPFLTTQTSSAPLTVSTSLLAPLPSPGLSQDEGSQPPTSNTSPSFERLVNLGVPVGNGATPRRLAVDSAAGLVYIFAEGLPILKQGNSLSVFNTTSGEFTAHASINQGSPTPLDLQVDPQTGRLYALWQPGFDQPPILTMLDAASLKVTQEISGVLALAVAPGQLYTVNDHQLIAWTAKSGRFGEQRHTDLMPASTTGPLAVNPANDHLYLARASDAGWSIEAFAADTLTSLGSYPISASVISLLPNPANGDLFVVEQTANDRLLYRLPSNLQPPTPTPQPYRLGPAYNANGLAISPDGRQLFFGNGELRPTNPTPGDTTGPALVSLSTADMSPSHKIPLLTNFDNVVFDAKTNQAFAVYPYDNLLYVVNLTDQTAQPVYTAVEIRDMEIDEETGQLYVSDSSRRIRRLNPNTLTTLAEGQLKTTADTYLSFDSSGGGELALDPTRHRLYVSGDPAYVLNADTLTQTDRLAPGGQFALDSTGDRVYLSRCGVTILNADTLSGTTILSGSGPRPDQFIPNPCVDYSQFDPQNRLLYSLVPNRVPGSNGGNYLYVYDLSGRPRQVFTDTNISITQAVPDPAHHRAFVGYARTNTWRLRTLSAPAGGPINYTRQLLGVRGAVKYSAATNRLYLSDSYRLLALDADTLNVLGTLPLPPGYDYRLVALDPQRNDRLYLAGYDGQLLIASGVGEASRQSDLTALRAAGELSPTTHTPQGAILDLSSAANGNLLARISIDPTYTDPRLFLSTDQGRTWLDLTPNLPDLPEQAAALSPAYPTDRTLWAAVGMLSGPGGLYQSTDAGQTWTPVLTGLRDLEVDQLFASPETNLIFANTLYAGLHYSTDAGQNWTPLVQLNPNAAITGSNQGAAAISRQGTILVSQSLDLMKGVFRARVGPDGKLSAWQKVLAEPLSLLALAPDGRIAFGFGTGLWRSADGGQSWQPGGAGLTGLDRFQATKFLFSPNFSRDQTVYLFLTDLRGEESGRLFRSTDAGQSWQPWAGPPNDQRITAVAMATNGDLLLGDSAAHVTRLSPASLSWPALSALSVSSLSSVDDLAVSPDFGRDHTLFAVSHADGLFKSTDGGQTWVKTAFPVRSTSFAGYRLAISPAFARDHTLYAATGFSLHRSGDGGQTWSVLTAADGLNVSAGEVALSPTFAADHTLLIDTPAGLLRSTDNGISWQKVLARPQSAGAARVLAFAADGRLVYAWFDYDSQLYVSADGGQTWQARAGQVGEYTSVTIAAVAPDQSLVFIPEFSTELWQVSQIGQSWRMLSKTLPNDLQGAQTMAYATDGTLLLGGSGGLFASSDNGQTWQTLLAGLDVQLIRISGSDRLVLLRDGQVMILK